MALTRRQFIKRTGLATAGAFLGPGFFRNPFLRQALADSLDSLDRYFVVVNLDGGNDGLNTVVPLADGGSGGLRTAYDAARTSLNLSPAQLATTAIGTDVTSGTPLALHPGLIGLKHLWDQGALAVIQGCGDPVSIDFLSHEFSRGVWQTGNPSSVNGYGGGWVGRYFQAAGYGGSDIPGVCIRDSVAGEFLQTATSVLALGRLADFGFPYDPDYPSDQAAKRDSFYNLYTQTQGNAQATLKYLRDSGTSTLLASENYPALDGQYTSDRSSYDAMYAGLGTGFASDLREVAKVIYGVKLNGDHPTMPPFPNVKARSFEVSNGGYDTHSDQGTDGVNDQHNQLHHQVGDAIEVFYNDLLDMGVAHKVCLVIWSEFSRRIQQNASGTDHGSQGPVFVIGGPTGIGGKLRGGVYGNHPNINDPATNSDGNTVYSQDLGNSYRSTDIRDVYGTLLKHWLGITDPSPLFPLDGGDPNLNWTAASFDLPFLA